MQQVCVVRRAILSEPQCKSPGRCHYRDQCLKHLEFSVPIHIGMVPTLDSQHRGGEVDVDRRSVQGDQAEGEDCRVSCQRYRAGSRVVGDVGEGQEHLIQQGECVFCEELVVGEGFGCEFHRRVP